MRSMVSIMTLRLPSSLRAEIETLAQDRRVTVSWIVREALWTFLASLSATAAKTGGEDGAE